jgi:hypothetical protein
MRTLTSYFNFMQVDKFGQVFLFVLIGFNFLIYGEIFNFKLVILFLFAGYEILL